jgi:uncharacterized protein YbjT (DUF2867 family)
MKVLVLGGSGPTGRLVVQMAKKAGHEVAAPSSAECDVKKAEHVARAAQGQDVVISLVSPKQKTDKVRSLAADALVAAKVKRVIFVSSSGAGDSIVGAAKGSFVFAKIVIPLVLKRQLADAAVAEEKLKASGIDFTVLRPMQLVDAALPGEATAIAPDAKAPSMKVSRAQLAGFIVKELESGANRRQMPVLCG